MKMARVLVACVAIAALVSAQDDEVLVPKMTTSNTGDIHFRLPRDGNLFVTRQQTVSLDAIELRLARLEATLATSTALTNFRNNIVAQRNDFATTVGNNVTQQLAELRQWVGTTMQTYASRRNATFRAAVNDALARRNQSLVQMRTAVAGIASQLTAIEGHVSNASGLGVANNPMVQKLMSMTSYGNSKIPVFRWKMWNTHPNANIGWFDENDRNGFAGVAPQKWSDNYGKAWDINNDLESLTRLFNQRIVAPSFGATVCATVDVHYSSTDGTLCGAVFRIRNTADVPRIWQPAITISSWHAWSESATISVNGENTWVSDCSSQCIFAPRLELPPNKVSTIIFISSAGVNAGGSYDMHQRGTILMFRDNALMLGDDLYYEDDLDVATGPWKY